MVIDAKPIDAPIIAQAFAAKVGPYLENAKLGLARLWARLISSFRPNPCFGTVACHCNSMKCFVAGVKEKIST
ncbi:hypothetical protein [Rhizobium leguminosarum]